MHISSLQTGPIFPSPYQSPKPSPKSTSTPNPIQNAGGQAVPSDPAQTSAKASEQVTGKGALQQPEEAAKNLRPELNLKDLEIVEDLKKRDREVRAHEAAHLGAADPYASSGPSYTYKRGPDGRQYAVGGEVQIDIAKVSGDPAVTRQKARVIRRAATAPAKPSSQNRAVASQAAAIEVEARKELAQERIEENAEASPSATEESAGAGLDETATGTPSQSSTHSMPEVEKEEIAPGSHRALPSPIGGRLDVTA